MDKKKREKAMKNGKSKFLGVRQRPSGKWVAEIKDTTHKIRLWLGTYLTPEEAARAYDEAAFLLRGSNTRINFPAHVASNSPISLKIKSLLPRIHTNKTPFTTTPSAKSTAQHASASGAQNQNHHHPYRPDILIDCSSMGLALDSAQFDHSWPCAVGFDFEHIPSATQEGIDMNGLSCSGTKETELTELEGKKGVNEWHMENASDVNGALWDSYTLSHMFSLNSCPPPFL